MRSSPAKLLWAAIILAMITIGCKTRHLEDSKHVVNPSELVKKDVDSLVKSGVDTLLIYSRHCSGCMPGLGELVALVWMENGMGFGKVYKPPFRIQRQAYLHIVFDAFVANEDSIRTSKEAVDPKSVLNGWLSTVRMQMGETQYAYAIMDWNLAINQDQYSLRYLALVESLVLRLMSN